VSTGICILRSWFMTDSPTYTSPMAPPLAAKPPAVPTLSAFTEHGQMYRETRSNCTIYVRHKHHRAQLDRYRAVHALVTDKHGSLISCSSQESRR